jgi:signal transduction histidine kinase
MAHDLNNFVSIINGSIEMLRRDGLDSEKRKQYVNAIGVTADRVAKMTDRLLRFSRVEAAGTGPFNVKACLEDIAEMIRMVCGSSVTLSLELPTGPLCIIRTQIHDSARTPGHS